jgi:LmbE family N-acetylglucosaminyl deacetylase
LGTILGVWAHPDDEAYLSAGLMALAVDQGRRVVCVTATTGEAGFPDADARSVEERIGIRRAEMAASLAQLGVTEHHWLGFSDGECAKVPNDDAVEIISDLIADVQPDTLLTFGPDGGTGHTDHIAVCRWSTLSCARSASKPRLLYATRPPGWIAKFFGPVESQIMMVEGMQPEAIPMDQMAVCFTCEGQLLDRKVRALRAQQSQVETLATALGAETFREAVREEFFRVPKDGDPVW